MTDIGPGDLVECIDADGAPTLKVGGIYTVYSVHNSRKTGEPGIKVEEADPTGHYRGFKLKRFRLVFKPKDGMTLSELMNKYTKVNV